MKIAYMAHPVTGDVSGNVSRSLVWLRALQDSFPEYVVIAPWLPYVMTYDNDAPGDVEACLARDCAVVLRCDELWTVGPRISLGMRREATFARSVRDFTELAMRLPPDHFAGLPPLEEVTPWLLRRGILHGVEASK